MHQTVSVSRRYVPQCLGRLSRAGLCINGQGYGHRWYTSTALERLKQPLRRVFDDEGYWKDINKPNYKSDKRFGLSFGSQLETGLFQNPYLKSANGLLEFTEHSFNRARELVHKIHSIETEEQLKHYIKDLDQLSDVLCRVIDLCEFIRATHPDRKFVQTAQQCHEKMFEIMNILNTDVKLCDLLTQCLDKSEALGLTSEEIRVGKILLEDFEKSGIYMEPEIREKFIDLSQEISVIGQEFISNTEFVRDNHVKISCNVLEANVNAIVYSQLKKDISGEHYKVPTYGYIPYTILRSCSDETIRKKIWTAMHSCSDEQIERLRKLVDLRIQLAKLLGSKNFAEYQLQGKMAKNPENVKGFLESLVDTTRVKAANELKPMARLKAELTGMQTPETLEEVLEVIKPWDRDYYGSIQALSQRRSSALETGESISASFSLGVVMQGLSDLLEKIYGIKLVPRTPKTGETWSPDVRRIDVIDENEGLIGVMYCDLFERDGKTPNPAHFTVCCSRNMYPNETDTSTIQVGVNSKGQKFQLPVISLVCDFRPSEVQMEDGSSVQICLLQLNEIETLFHEMGHAMHSMLGRTQLQNVSGTRCATDFVELPSILMEHFARDTRVLSSISSHYKTGESLDIQILKNHQLENQFLQNCETFSQIKMSLLDQELHNLDQNGASIDVVRLYHRLERRLRVMPDNESNWCGKFGHLFGYGASYYSYLFDRAIASRIWEHLFEQNPFDRTNGTKLKEGLLQWGGSRDPWFLLSKVLDEPRLAKGDEWGMRYIGDVKSGM